MDCMAAGYFFSAFIKNEKLQIIHNENPKGTSIALGKINSILNKSLSLLQTNN